MQDHPIHVVTKWMGNTPSIAMRHYLQVSDADFDRAVRGESRSAGAAQNAAQYTHESGRTDLEAQKETPVFPEEYEGLRYCTPVQVEAAGIEPASRDISMQASTCVVG